MEVLGAGRFLRLVRRDGWEWAERVNARGVVVVVARTPESRVLMVEQYRPPVGARVLELPAGLAGDEAAGESLSDAAARELEEETGWRAGRIEPLPGGPGSAGMSSEVLSLFLATELQRIGPGGGVGNEAIVVHEVPQARVPDFVAERAAEGVMTDPKVFAGLFWLARLGAP